MLVGHGEIRDLLYFLEFRVVLAVEVQRVLKLIFLDLQLLVEVLED